MVAGAVRASRRMAVATFRVDRALFARLKTVAVRTRVSRGKLIRDALERELAYRESQAKATAP